MLLTILEDGTWFGRAALFSTKTGEYTVLIEDAYGARYASTGHIVFGRDATLWAVPFDLGGMEVTGREVRVIEDVEMDQALGLSAFSLSADGMLAYVRGVNVGERELKELVWVDRSGRETTISAEPRAYQRPRISPQGDRLAISVYESGNQDIWIYDFTRDTLSPLTFDLALDDGALWTPDGQRIVFASNRSGKPGLYWKAADGSGQDERLMESSSIVLPEAFSPDSQRLLFRQEGPQQSDIYVLSLEEEPYPGPLLQTQFDEDEVSISPDGNWIAHEWNRTGREEVYVRPFPNVDDGQWQISTGGGGEPRWRADGRELFYRIENKMMAVAIETEPAFAANSPVILFEGSYVGAQPSYDTDGERFLMLKSASSEQTTSRSVQLVVVENWFSELQRLAIPFE